MPYIWGSGKGRAGNGVSDRTAYPQIEASTFRRVSSLLAIKLVRRFRKHHGTVLFLSKKTCVKYGRSTSLGEASTMQFIAMHTSIPIPRVHCAFVHQNRTYIVMERIHGQPIGAGWVWRSEESKAKLLSQLRTMVEEMRRIIPPEGIGVAGINGGPLYDPRLPGTSNSFGPFKTIEDFHKHLRGGLPQHPQHNPEISELIAQHNEPRSPVVFTHGDLSSLNILVSGDKIVGIVDWETAGWYPSYWEYTTAWNVNPQNQFWQSEVDKFLQPRPKELEMEKVRLKYFGDT